MSAHVLRALDLTRHDDNRFTATNVPQPRGGPVFGGQLLGQITVAAARCFPDKKVRSVQTLFARGGDPGQDLDVVVETLHAGRTMTSATITVQQGARSLCRALVLLDADDPDIIRHGAEMPRAAGPGEGVNAHFTHPGSDLRLVDDVDLDDPAATGPAVLNAWVRWPGVDDGDVAVNQAFAAWYTDSLLIGVAMRPHAGVGGRMAHDTVATSVITHTLAFHEHSEVSEWHLLALTSSYAGHGRAYGTGQIFTQAGQLVCSFSQDAMLRSALAGSSAARSGAGPAVPLL